MTLRHPKIFTGRANPLLAKSITDFLELELGENQIRDFDDGETWVKFEENIRGVDLFLVQPTFAPAGNLMELLVMVDAARRASAKRITAVIPYFGYARQDRKDQPRVAITAKLVANLLTTSGVDRILAMDMHAPQIQGFFDIPLDHLYASAVFIDHFNNMNLSNFVIVSPDIGGTRRARAYAKRLHLPIAIVDKRRPKPNVAEVMHIIGDIDGKNVLLFDDICDTGGTLVAGADHLKKRGAKNIYAACTHPILSGDAAKRIADSEITEMLVTDTIPLSSESRKIEKIKVLSVAEIFGRAIMRIHNEESISSLFDTTD